MIEALDMNDLDQLESLMVQLSLIQKECSEMIKTLFDENMLI